MNPGEEPPQLQILRRVKRLLRRRRSLDEVEERRPVAVQHDRVTSGPRSSGMDHGGDPAGSRQVGDQLDGVIEHRRVAVNLQEEAPAVLGGNPVAPGTLALRDKDKVRDPDSVLALTLPTIRC